MNTRGNGTLIFSLGLEPDDENGERWKSEWKLMKHKGHMMKVMYMILIEGGDYCGWPKMNVYSNHLCTFLANLMTKITIRWTQLCIGCLHVRHHCWHCFFFHHKCPKHFSFPNYYGDNVAINRCRNVISYHHWLGTVYNHVGRQRPLTWYNTMAKWVGSFEKYCIFSLSVSHFSVKECSKFFKTCTIQRQENHAKVLFTATWNDQCLGHTSASLQSDPKQQLINLSMVQRPITGKGNHASAVIYHTHKGYYFEIISQMKH